VYDHPLLGWEGVEAVVDKDRVAAILARQLDD
jgi:carbamate kinase